MILLINKDQLSETFIYKSVYYDNMDDEMLNDLMDSESLDEFRMDYPESYNHYLKNYRHLVKTENPDYEDILFDIFNITLIDEEDWDEDDEY